MLLLVLINVLLALATLAAYLLYRNLNYWRQRGIPYDEPHPIFGNLVGFRTTRTIHAVLSEFYNKYRKSGHPFVGFYFLNKPSAFILDVKLAKNILIKDFSNFADRGQFYNEKDDPLTAHLFNLDGIRWKQLRHKISPTLTSGKLKHMFPTTLKVATELVQVMEEQVAPAGSVIEIKELMARYTTDVIGTCGFGIECNTLRDTNMQFRTMGTKAFTELRHGPAVFAFMFSFPALARKLRLKATPQDVHEFFMNLVHETVAYREREQIKRNDFMDTLIELKNKGSVTLETGEVISGVTMDEIAAQTFVFFLAGYETSSSAMSFALYELARHTDLQQRLRAEIEQVMEQHEQQLTYECIKDMKYLHQVISETLRLYSTLPQLDRRAQKDYVVPGHPKYVIEAGTSIIIPSAAMHHDPELYPEPEIFDPERFTAENCAKRDSVEYLAFGDGPRNCVGLRFGQMQSRIGLVQMIRKFKFSTCEQTADPLVYDPKSFLLATIGGIHLKVERV